MHGQPKYPYQIKCTNYLGVYILSVDIQLVKTQHAQPKMLVQSY